MTTYAYGFNTEYSYFFKENEDDEPYVLEEDIDDDIYDYINTKLDEELQNADCEEIVSDYGFYQAYKLYVEEYGEGCLNVKDEDKFYIQLAFVIIKNDVEVIEYTREEYLEKIKEKVFQEADEALEEYFKQKERDYVNSIHKDIQKISLPRTQYITYLKTKIEELTKWEKPDMPQEEKEHIVNEIFKKYGYERDILEEYFNK